MNSTQPLRVKKLSSPPLTMMPSILRSSGRSALLSKCTLPTSKNLPQPVLRLQLRAKVSSMPAMRVVRMRL